jgi:hypothetical protein
MKIHNTKNNTHNFVMVTSEDLFIGLPFSERIPACKKMIEGKATQFINETSILLDLARKDASVYVSCEAENDTDICAILAGLDMGVEEVARQAVEKLESVK